MDVIVIESEAFYALIDKVVERLRDKEEVLNKWIDGADAKAVLGVERTKLAELRRDGEIEYSKMGRKILYNRFSLEEYVERNSRKTFS